MNQLDFQHKVIDYFSLNSACSPFILSGKRLQRWSDLRRLIYVFLLFWGNIYREYYGRGFAFFKISNCLLFISKRLFESCNKIWLFWTTRYFLVSGVTCNFVAEIFILNSQFFFYLQILPLIKIIFWDLQLFVVALAALVSHRSVF